MGNGLSLGSHKFGDLKVLLQDGPRELVLGTSLYFAKVNSSTKCDHFV